MTTLPHQGLGARTRRMRAPGSRTAAPSFQNCRTVESMLTRSLARTGLSYQTIQSLTFQSIELTLWQSAAQNVSKPKLVTAWAVVLHKVQCIISDQAWVSITLGVRYLIMLRLTLR